MAIKYVDEFEFPKESGFTESTPKYARGGKVGHKPNPGSPQFRTKYAGMKSMDDGVQPARKGRTEQEIEAGGTKKLRPKFARGGKAKNAHDKMYKEGGKMGYGKGGKYAVGGAIVKGAKKVIGAANRVVGAKKGQGEVVKAVGRGKKPVSK